MGINILNIGLRGGTGQLRFLREHKCLYYFCHCDKTIIDRDLILGSFERGEHLLKDCDVLV